MRKYKKDSTLVWAARVCIYLCCILFLNTETLALAIAALILILGFEVINQISKRYSKMEEIAEKQKELLEKQVKQQEHKTNIIMEIKNLIVQISDQKEKRRKSLVSKIGCLGRPSNKENALLKEIFAFEQLEFGVYSIVKYKGFNERIIKIPKTYRGMKIVGIGDCAFEDCTSLQRIEIEASILFVGKRAFSNCRNLKDILLPGCIETIGDKAFYLCKKLRRCGYSDNVTLLGNPFENSGISSLVFPRTMHEIPNCFLRGCSNINEITIPGFIKKIGVSAFSQCERLSIVHIIDGCIEICDTAFINCYNLRKVYIPSSVTKIGYRVFSIEIGYRPTTMDGSPDMRFNVNYRTCDNSKLTIYCEQGSHALIVYRGTNSCKSIEDKKNITDV